MLAQAFLNEPLGDKCLDLENQINVVGTLPKKLFGILKYGHFTKHHTNFMGKSAVN